MLINRYFNIKQNCHRSFHIFLACYVEILVFGGLWRSAVNMGLFRMINFVKKAQLRCVEHRVKYVLLCHRIRIRIKVNSNKVTVQYSNLVIRFHARKSCSETNTKAALRYRSTTILKLLAQLLAAILEFLV